MSYVFMKILEGRPESYDAGIRRISGADWNAIRAKVAADIGAGERVLELGCGPGTLAIELAKRGAEVTAVDRNPQMLDFARTQAEAAGVKVDWRWADLERPLAVGEGYDWVVSSLAFSELRPVVRRAVLARARAAMKPGGRLVIVDEVKPEAGGERVRYGLSRWYWGLRSWWRTRSGTAALAEFGAELARMGYGLTREEELAPGLKLWEAEARPGDAGPEPDALAAGWGPRDWLKNVPRWLTSHILNLTVAPGLYRVGNPGPGSPLLATGNYRLTVSLVRRYLRGRDAWLLVNDTRGINVWCAAGKGNFSAAEIAVTLAASGAERFVSGREIVLPKLGMVGVKRREVKELSGFSARVGPVYAHDLPAYLDAGGKKTEAMERIEFGLASRLWFGVPFGVLMALVTGLLVLVSGGRIMRALPLWFFGVSLLVAVTYNRLPTRRHLVKGLVLGALMALGVASYLTWQGAAAVAVARSGALIAALGLFVTADFSGSTPVSNRTIVEGEVKTIYAVLAGLLTVYVALPKIMGVMSW